ncbi:MAG: T9SS type A sorting domain-containing protein [Bacteroidota bacterium]
MKNVITLILLICITALVETAAQTRYVDVAPDPVGQAGALNNAIRGDTIATGERIDPDNTIYRLERDGVYNLSLAIINTGFPLVIEAAEGNGNKPLIRPSLTLEGESDVPFRPLDDIKLIDLSISGNIAGGGLEDQIIRVQNQDIRIVVDNCFVDESSQTFLRTDSRGSRIFITNSVIGRMGTPDDIDNGRVVDDRGVFIDTLFMENNTIYNVTSRVVRDGTGSDSYINYVRFNQNNVFNVGQRMADFGPVIDFTFTNNIIVNPSFNGIQVEPDPFNPDQPDPNGGSETAAIIVDSVSQSILADAGVAQTADIRNNNIYHTTAFLAARPERNPDPNDNDFVLNRRTFSPTAQAFMELSGSADTNISEELEFENPPIDPTVFTVEFWNNYDGSIILSPWDDTGSPFSFRYPGASLSSLSSTTGQALGDLNWPLLVISKDALQELADDANELLSLSAIGNNIGNIIPEAADSLSRTVILAQAVIDNPAATDEQIENAIDDLNDAINFFLDSIITSTEPDTSMEVLIYPNPVKDRLFVQAQNGVLSHLSLRDLTGSLVRDINPERDLNGINMSDLQPGMYLLKTEFTDGASHQIKILKH